MQLTDENQRSVFTLEEAEALKLIQEYTHHRDLKIKANSSFKTRLDTFAQTGYLSANLRQRLQRAAGLISKWLFDNALAMWNIIHRLVRKNHLLIKGGYYTKDDIFSVVFLESFRILYNYKFDGKAEPLTYLICVLRLRARNLFGLEVPNTVNVCYIEGKFD